MSIKQLTPDVGIAMACFVLAYLLWASDCPGGICFAPLTFVMGWGVATMRQKLQDHNDAP